MQKKERIHNAMNFLPVDRIPTAFYTHFEDQHDNTVADQVQWANECNMDALCVETDGFMKFAWDGPLVTADDWGKIRPHKKDDWYIAGQVDRAKRIADGLKDSAAVFYMIYTPYSTIKHTLGGETRVNELFRANPDAISQAMQVIEQDNLLVIRELRSSGIDGLFISLQNAELWRFTPEEYAEYLTPWDQRLIKAANEAFADNIIHLCSWGCEPNNVQVWHDYDYKVVNWGVNIENDLSLAQGRAYFKPHSTLMGGFDVRPGKVIMTGSEHDIKQQTRHYIDEAGTTGFILGTDCSLQKETPSEHIRWVVEACEEYSRGI